MSTTTPPLPDDLANAIERVEWRLANAIDCTDNTFVGKPEEVIPLLTAAKQSRELQEQLEVQKGKTVLQANRAGTAEQQLHTQNELIEKLIHALRCANNSFFGSPTGQVQIDEALSLAREKGFGKKGER